MGGAILFMHFTQTTFNAWGFGDFGFVASFTFGFAFVVTLFLLSYYFVVCRKGARAGATFGKIVLSGPFGADYLSRIGQAKAYFYFAVMALIASACGFYLIAKFQSNNVENRDYFVEGIAFGNIAYFIVMIVLGIKTLKKVSEDGPGIILPFPRRMLEVILVSAAFALICAFVILKVLGSVTVTDNIYLILGEMVLGGLLFFLGLTAMFVWFNRD